MIVGFAMLIVFTLVPTYAQLQSEIDIETGSSFSANVPCVNATNCFSPNPLTVIPGTTVTWNNLDSVSHTITSVNSQCNGPHFTIQVQTDNLDVDPTVMIRTSLTQVTYAKLAQYQPFAADNVIAPIRKLVYEAYVSPASKSFEVVVVEGIGKNTYSVKKTVNVSGCDVGSLFDSGIIPSEKKFEFTFSTPGNYNYFCTIHPWMMGQVIVGNLVSGNQNNSTQSRVIETTNHTTQVIIPEFPASTMSAIIVSFTLLLLIRFNLGKT